ncbi:MULTISPECIES: ABC transporter substrate-binding protein [unclassified Stappia]|uniref:substrate-binding periplasmic protein n=1 Tax=unclassified Stappia TaxID=2629676 RepID=UPI0016439079|nr:MULTISPECIES: ABC transporter substrate-binding protein [unclassified Stappia]
MIKKLAATLILSVGLTLPSLAKDLTVGVTTTGVPFTFVDTATQKPTGAMVDIAEAIAAEAGLTVKFELSAFSALIPALTTGKIDLISAGMFASEKRMEVVDFSTGVYTYGDAMFVAAADDTAYTLDMLKGETVGAQVGTVFADKLNSLGIFSEVKQYDSLADIMREVKLGRIKAGFGDKPIIAYQIAQNPDFGVRLVEGYTPMSEGTVALAVAKDNPELLETVNAALAKMSDSGELAKIFAKYGL